MTGSLVKGTLLVAGALPIRVASWIATLFGAGTAARRLRLLTTGIHLAAYLVTGLVWAFLLPDGVLYPIFDSANLEHSWGGPSLACAWVVHFLLGAVVLLIVSLPFAVWRPPGANPGS